MPQINRQPNHGGIIPANAGITPVRFAFDGDFLSGRDYTSNQTEAVYTVPADHWFLLGGWTVCFTAQATATADNEVTIKTDADATVYILFSIREHTDAENIIVNNNCVPPYQMGEGWYIEAVATADVRIVTSVWGYEVVKNTDA
jgi:hypothetical protein